MFRCCSVLRPLITRHRPLGSFDAVTYFLAAGAPALAAGPGPEINATITAQHDGATYRFASEDHKERFLKDPAKYLPEYGGFCAAGTANGVKVDGDPTVWKIIDNKLYLNFAPVVAERWNKDIAGNVKTANEKWRVIKDKAPSELLQ